MTEKNIDLVSYMTEEEIKMFNNYRRAYAAYGIDDEGEEETYDPNSYRDENVVLRHWVKNKQYLFKLFGGESLILKKKVSFKEDRSKVEVRMYGLRDMAFAVNYIRFVNTHANSYSDVYFFLLSLISQEFLAENSLIHNDRIPTSGYHVNILGQELVFQRSMKTVKALGKIAKTFNIEGFEEFRIAHSQILNTETSMGTLCLSIHPLDFATSSDNDNGWESCMSWLNYGCYRQGTVEMMNSPYVVIAYLESSSNSYNIWVSEDAKNYSWNSKKWRSYFIVHPSGIYANKNYPFNSSALNIEVISWLKNLAAKNVEGTYSNDIEIFYNNKDFKKNDKYYRITFETDHMYNDFEALSCCQGSEVVYNPAFFKNGSNFRIGRCRCGDSETTLEAFFNFSGPSQCMICGQLADPDSHSLLCSNCVIYEEYHEYDYCVDCGEEHDIEDGCYDSFDNFWCPHCWAEQVRRDIVYGGYYDKDYLDKVYIAPEGFDMKHKEKLPWVWGRNLVYFTPGVTNIDMPPLEGSFYEFKDENGDIVYAINYTIFMEIFNQKSYAYTHIRPLNYLNEWEAEEDNSLCQHRWLKDIMLDLERKYCIDEDEDTADEAAERAEELTEKTEELLKGFTLCRQVGSEQPYFTLSSISSDTYINGTLNIPGIH